MFAASVTLTGLRNLYGEEAVDEPYVLIAAVRLDGMTIKIDFDADFDAPVRANPVVDWTHIGRITTTPEEVDDGKHGQFDPQWATVTYELEPISVTFEQKTQHFPGVIAVLASLHEEDSTTNGTIGSIQRRLKPYLEGLLKASLESIDRVDIQRPAGADGPTLERDRPLEPDYLQALMAYLKTKLTDEVLAPVADETRRIATEEGLTDAPFVGWFDHDDTLGDALWILPTPEIPFDSWAEGPRALPDREVSQTPTFPGAEFEEQHWHYVVSGEITWRAHPSHRLQTVLTADNDVRLTEYDRVRRLESDHGACGSVGAEVVLGLIGSEKSFDIVVIRQRPDEFAFTLRIGPLTITSAGAKGEAGGTFDIAGPHGFTFLAAGSGVWATATYAIPGPVRCNWELLDPIQLPPDGTFGVRLSRTRADDLRPPLSIPVHLTGTWAGAAQDVATTVLSFPGARLDNPVLECIAGHENVLIAVNPVDDIPRPPWMDPPARDPDFPDLDSPGWLEQLRPGEN